MGKYSAQMTRLSGLDGIVLHAETPVMRTHIVSVLFCDPDSAHGTVTADAILATLAQRRAAMPAFGKRLVGKPFGLGQPVWVDVADFDVRDHLHRVRLPDPGSVTQLAEFVGDIHSQQQHRKRPPWDAWVVDGLADGRIALVIKLSHAMTDGVGGVTSLLPQLTTTDPAGELPPTPEPTPAVAFGATDMIRDMADEIARNTVGGTRVALRLSPWLAGALFRSTFRATLRSAGRLLPGGSRHGEDATDGKAESSPRTALNAPITARRSVAFAALRMDDLHAIADAYDVTINDVFLTAAASAVRRWLITYDSLPDQPLRTLMPVSTREDDDDSANSFGLALVELPTQRADPVDQLAAIHAATSRVKSARKSAPPVSLAELLDLVPPALIGSVADVYTGQKLSRFHAPLAHLVTSNVPGPAQEVYCAGARVVGIHGVAPLFEGSNLNITAVSHGGAFDVGITSCPDNVKDVASVARDLEGVVGELLDAIA